MQVVCDKKKRILYRSIISRGIEHDSTAFKNSNFYKVLEEKWKYFLQEGLYLISDSAYASRSFLITPFDNAIHGTSQDDFNFFHSSSRIYIECTFGKVDMRWGILKKPLGFTLSNNIQVIDAWIWLHNFIVGFREENQKRAPLEELDKPLFEKDCLLFLSLNPEIVNFGVLGGDNELQSTGRPNKRESESRKAGGEIRNQSTPEVRDNKYTQPKANWFREHNSVYN